MRNRESSNRIKYEHRYESGEHHLQGRRGKYKKNKISRVSCGFSFIPIFRNTLRPKKRFRCPRRTLSRARMAAEPDALLVPDIFVYDDEEDGKKELCGKFLSSDGASAREIAQNYGGTALRYLKNDSILINKPPPAGNYAIFRPKGNNSESYQHLKKLEN